MAFAATIAAASSGAQTPAPTPPYRDASRPVDERVRDLLGRMTLEEKFWQLYMIPGRIGDTASDYSHGVFGLQTRVSAGARADAQLHNDMQRFLVERTRLGVPMIPFEEAVHGLMRRGATVFPAAIALAATWDTTLMGDVATAIARETRSRGIRQVLSPVVNVATDVRWGRVEETYGEDPVLASAMARAYVRPFTRAGVIATPKHFVANIGEGGRDSYPIDVSRRVLEEIHFPPFRAALDAGAQSVMTAYNSVDGVPATQNHWLLTETLRHEWGFTGFVISDQAATSGPTVLQHTEASTATAVTHALDAGLDVVFQSSWPQHRPYLDAFTRGLIADAVIDSAVARVLRAKVQLGLFERPYVEVDSAAFWNGSAGHRRLAREASRESIVLLGNARGTLPFTSRVRSVAVIGMDAAEARLGGYTVDEARGVSLLDALRSRLGNAAVRHAPGPGRATREFVRVPASSLAELRGEYWDNIHLDGAPRAARPDSVIDFSWTLNAPAAGIPVDWYSVRWTGRLVAPATGVRRLGVEGSDGYRLYLDGRLLIDDWQKRSSGVHLATVSLRPGTSHDIRLEFFETIGNAHVRLVWDAGVADDWRAKIASAVAAANASDVAVVVAGIEEGEFRDRALLSLPGHQEDLIQQVAATGKPVVVVLIGGSAITMPWLEKVGAVLDAWYPGEEGGNAIADVLFGDANPGGRLPITFPVSEGQLPLVYDHKPTGRGDDYVDLTGQPLFPFGFGLSYTTFEYSDLRIDGMDVSFRLKNTGSRAGDEVVQLYMHDMLASVSRPVLELKRFARVRLAPGEAREMRFTLGRKDLEFLDENMRLVLEPGVFRVLVGASSRDIRLRGDLVPELKRE